MVGVGAVMVNTVEKVSCVPWTKSPTTVDGPGAHEMPSKMKTALPSLSRVVVPPVVFPLPPLPAVQTRPPRQRFWSWAEEISTGVSAYTGLSSK